MAGLREKFNSIIWEAEGPTSSATPVSVSIPVPVQTVDSMVQRVVSAPTMVPSRIFVDTSQVDSEIKASLDQAVGGANQKSYTEFTTFYNAMLSDLDGENERTVYKAALAAAKGKGFNAQEIARGIDAILQVLQDEERNFNEEVAQRTREKVGGRQQERDRLAQKIGELEAEISSSRSRQESLSADIRLEQEKVENMKRRFSATLTVEKNRFADERKRILAYSGKEA